MFALGNTTFIAYDFNQDAKAANSFNLAQFNSSANFIFGIVDNSIDLFNNPYIRVNAYRMSEDFKLKESEKMQLRKCKLEDLTAFMSEQTAKYYPNSLCFADRSKVEIEGNWFSKNFKTIHLTVEECIGSGCKTRDEIASFMKR